MKYVGAVTDEALENMHISMWGHADEKSRRDFIMNWPGKYFKDVPKEWVDYSHLIRKNK